MAVKVIMPQAGQDLETGTVKHWLKAVGDRVAKGESIVQIETEKISTRRRSARHGSSPEDRRPGRDGDADLLHDRDHR